MKFEELEKLVEQELLWEGAAQEGIQYEKDIGDESTLIEVCDELNLKSEEIFEKALVCEKLYHSLAYEAANNNVFGSPSYVLDEEVFWGQDRLDLLEDTILKSK